MITEKLLVFLLIATSTPLAYTRHVPLWSKLMFPDDIVVGRHHSYQTQNEKTSENHVDTQNNKPEIVNLDISGNTVESENESYQVQDHQNPEIKVVDINGNVADSDSDKYEVQNRNIHEIVNTDGHKQTKKVHGSKYQVDTQNNSPEIVVVDINGNIVDSQNGEYQGQDQQISEVQVMDINGNVVDSYKYDYSEIIEVNVQNDEQKMLDQSYPEIHVVNTRRNVQVQDNVVHHRNNREITEKVTHQVPIVNNSKTERNANNQTVCETLQCKRFAESLVKSMNKTENPCEDFYEFACGKWEASNPSPPYRLVWNSFAITDDTTKRRLKEIFESTVKPSDILPMRQAKEWYQSCMNTERLEQRGIEPIKSIMMKIGGWPIAMDEDKWNETQYTWQDVENHYTRLTGSYVFYDVGALSMKLGNYSALTLDAPSRSPLKFNNDNYSGYRNLVSRIAQLFGTSNGASISNDRLLRESEELVLFEKAIFELKRADASYYGSQVKRMKEWYNSNTTTEWLGNPKSNIDWSSLIQELFELAEINVHPSSYVYIKNKGYIKGINELLNRTSRRTVVNYIHWNFITKVYAFTNQNMREEFVHRLWDQEFHLKEREPRWLECVNEMKLTHVAAYAYVEKYFKQDIKSAAQDMVENIRVSLEQTIDNSNWMDQNAKTLSKEKLNNMKLFVGFPNWYNKTKIIDYYKGITTGAEYFENNLSYMRYEKAQNLKLYVTPRPLIDPFIGAGEEPIHANALYERTMNYAVFPAVGFQTQFIELDLPDNVNYAKIGFLIGHEMSHAYDNCAIALDKDGKKTQLTDETLRSFYERFDCFVDQYDGYHNNTQVVNGTKWKCNGEDHGDDKTDGQRTAGENIADTTGLQAAFQAYKKISKTKNPNGGMRFPGLEEFTDDQLFFLSFASTLCESEALSYTAVRSYRNHPQMSLRVLGSLSNTKDFAKAFNCPTDSSMNPANRCSVWNTPGA